MFDKKLNLYKKLGVFLSFAFVNFITKIPRASIKLTSVTKKIKKVSETNGEIVSVWFATIDGLNCVDKSNQRKLREAQESELF